MPADRPQHLPRGVLFFLAALDATAKYMGAFFAVPLLGMRVIGASGLSLAVRRRR